MNEDITAGGRFDVAFSFYSGSAGVSPVNDAGEAVVAIRRAAPRAWRPEGMIAGQPVQLVEIVKSPVEGYVRFVARYLPVEDSAA